LNACAAKWPECGPLSPADASVDGFDITAPLEIEEIPAFRIGAIGQLEEAMVYDKKESIYLSGPRKK
jgi:hypothetical protein